MGSVARVHILPDIRIGVVTRSQVPVPSASLRKQFCFCCASVKETQVNGTGLCLRTSVISLTVPSSALLKTFLHQFL